MSGTPWRANRFFEKSENRMRSKKPRKTNDTVQAFLQNSKNMGRKLSTRLDAIETQAAGGTISATAEAMLAAVYGRLHALFLPCRTTPTSWAAIRRLRRGYLDSSIGISAAVSGQRNWVAGHDARRELAAAGLAVAVRGSVETTGLILTPKGRAVALSLCFRLMPTIPLSGAMAERLASLEPCRTRNGEQWISESKLFAMDCQGDTAGWQEFTDMLLEVCISGAAESTADVVGHVFYRHLKPFEDLPAVDGVEASEQAEDAYLAAFKSELGRLRRLEDPDGEIVIPLSVT